MISFKTCFITVDYQEEYLYQEYFQTITSLDQFGDPSNWQEAFDLYRELLAAALQC